MNLVIRYTENLQEDLARNWSSWNYGTDGFTGTKEELQNAINELDTEDTIYISGFDLLKEQAQKDLDNSNIAELYANYWVCKDTVNGSFGLCCWELQSENLEDAKEEIKNSTTFTSPSGDGNRFNAKDFVQVIFTGINNIGQTYHIIQIK